MKVVAVTGFVPDAFPARHLSPQQFADLGQRLRDAVGDRLVVHERRWGDCWAADLVRTIPGLLPSCVSPPADRFATPEDMVRSNVVLLERFRWLEETAAGLEADDVVVWIEWSILKQRGVTPEILRGFLDAIERDPPTAITGPGCWPVSLVNDNEAHWRFVGSCLIVPVPLAAPLRAAVLGVASLRAMLTHRLSWDMNTLAFVELLSVLPFQWYPAGHDETQFTRYGERQ